MCYVGRRGIYAFANHIRNAQRNESISTPYISYYLHTSHARTHNKQGYPKPVHPINMQEIVDSMGYLGARKQKVKEHTCFS